MSLLILFSFLGFLFAIPNNVFSFVTFSRSPCLRTGVGHYLLCLSVINQINLGLFSARLTHLAISITSTSSASNWNNILCKLLNYFLLSSGRMVFWFSSLIAIERLYMTLVLNGRWLKQPHIARRLIALTIIGILLTTLYEFFFYKSLFIADISQRSMCVFEFPMSYRYQWTTIHLLISTLNSLVPILINLCATVTISVVVVKKRMNTLRTKKSQFWIEKAFDNNGKICLVSLEIRNNQSALVNFQQRIRFTLSVLNENKELVIGPGITLIPQLFSLPLFISSFTLDCRNIENSWLRYLLTASYWASFTPQLTSFFLYISPSSFYSGEWRKTKTRQSMHLMFTWRHSDRTGTIASTSSSANMRDLTKTGHWQESVRKGGWGCEGGVRVWGWGWVRVWGWGCDKHTKTGFVLA